MSELGINLKGKQVKILYVSQHRLVLKLINKRRIIITPEIDDHSYDDVVAFLEFEETENGRRK